VNVKFFKIFNEMEGKMRILFNLLFILFSINYLLADVSPPEEIISIQKSIESVIESSKQAVVFIAVLHERSTMRYTPPLLFNPQTRFRPSETTKFGAGFFIKDEYIVTNYNLVKNAKKIEVELENRKKIPATLVGYHAKLDIALIKIETKEKITPIKLGDSDSTKNGDIVIAIGHPFGYTASATFGIVSATGRLLLGQTKRIANLIQTDAAMSIGTYGGPLLNLKGEVIGVCIPNPASIQMEMFGIDMPTGGIGFAVPINEVKKILPELISGKKIEYKMPYIGVQFDRESENVQGIKIKSVQKNSPAEKAGIKKDDILIEVDGKELEDYEDIAEILAEKEVGDTLKCKILRENKEINIELKLEETPSISRISEPFPQFPPRPNIPRTPRTTQEEIESFTHKETGITFSNITKELIEKYELSEKEKGVIISHIEKDSIGEKAGLKEKDIIKEINERSISDVIELKRILEKNKGKEITLTIIRKGRWQNISLSLP
jgi:serine protease Do